MASIKDRLAAAKLPERSLQVCLRGDLAAEFDELERQLKAARQASGPRRLNQRDEAVEIAAKIEALRSQMADELLELRIRALPRAEWQALVRKFPPSEDNEGERAVGVNLTALMEEAIPACVVEPELDADDWEKLNAVLSAGDYDRLLTVVFDVNRSGAEIPKSRLASLVMSEGSGD